MNVRFGDLDYIVPHHRNETPPSMVIRRVHVGECLAWHGAVRGRGLECARHRPSCIVPPMPVTVQVRMSHLFDSLPFEILCSHEFVGELDVIYYSVRLWSVA